ncbi:hypothetical protein [Neisseria weixii]|uniref:hypothetical protein n=1 Tax=Neisseria weixii TaxID=1853276 RepID=UPI00131563EA|nr:hypothetical protein [Neisseria weixii]
MASINLTQWGENTTLQIAVDKQHEIVDIIIGTDDLFIRREHAVKLQAALAAQLEGDGE